MKHFISLVICLVALASSSLAIPTATTALFTSRTPTIPSNIPHITTITTTTTRTSTYYYTGDGPVEIVCGLPVQYTVISTTITSGHSSYSTTIHYPYTGGCDPGAVETELDILYVPYPVSTTTSGLISYTELSTGANGGVTEIVHVPTTALGTKVVYQTSGIIDFTSTAKGMDGSATVIVNVGSTSTVTMVVTEDTQIGVQTTYTTSASSSTSRQSINSRSSTSSPKLTSISSKSSSNVSKSSATLPVVSSIPSQSAASSDDITILQLGLFLGYLEATLYQSGVAKYNEQQFEMAGFARPFRDNVVVINQQNHATTQAITDIISKAGAVPFPNCTFQFNSTSPQSLIGLGNIVTSISISSLIGSSSALMKDNAYLLTFVSSLAVAKARQGAYIRTGLGSSPFPNSFDTLLPPSWAYNLAQPYVVSCPKKLNYPTYPKLILTSPVFRDNIPPKTPLKAGTNLTFAYDASRDSAPQKATYIALLNSNSNVVYVPAKSCGVGCASILTTPDLGGIVYAVLTHLVGVGLPELTNGGTLAGPCVILIS